uniref:Uncharacterized protein n=1 Tax=Lotharella globosa TaxID=91324 RepID=A0A7S3Z6R5_9EUKA
MNREGDKHGREREGMRASGVGVISGLKYKMRPLQPRGSDKHVYQTRGKSIGSQEREKNRSQKIEKGERSKNSSVQSCGEVLLLLCKIEITNTMSVVAQSHASFVVPLPFVRCPKKC